MINTHSCRHGKFSNAQFFFRGNFPFHENCTTCVPAAVAISCVPSVLAESTTTISSANETLARQSRRFAASFLTGTSTDNGARALDRSLIDLSRASCFRAPDFPRRCFEVLHPSSRPRVHQQLLPHQL